MGEWAEFKSNFKPFIIITSFIFFDFDLWMRDTSVINFVWKETYYGDTCAWDFWFSTKTWVHFKIKPFHSHPYFLYPSNIWLMIQIVPQVEETKCWWWFDIIYICHFPCILNSCCRTNSGWRISSEKPVGSIFASFINLIFFPNFVCWNYEVLNLSDVGYKFCN